MCCSISQRLFREYEMQSAGSFERDFFSFYIFSCRVWRTFRSLSQQVICFRWVGNTGIKGAHSKVLEVLVIPDKTHKADMSLMLPQVGVKFTRLIISTRVLLIFVWVDLFRNEQESDARKFIYFCSSHWCFFKYFIWKF